MDEQNDEKRREAFLRMLFLKKEGLQSWNGNQHFPLELMDWSPRGYLESEQKNRIVQKKNCLIAPRRNILSTQVTLGN